MIRPSNWASRWLPTVDHLHRHTEVAVVAVVPLITQPPVAEWLVLTAVWL